MQIKKQPKKPETEVISLRVTKEFAVRLDAFSKYLESEKPYIVQEAVTEAMRGDKKFWEFVNKTPSDLFTKRTAAGKGE